MDNIEGVAALNRTITSTRNETIFGSNILEPGIGKNISDVENTDKTFKKTAAITVITNDSTDSKNDCYNFNNTVNCLKEAEVKKNPLVDASYNDGKQRENYTDNTKSVNSELPIRDSVPKGAQNAHRNLRIIANSPLSSIPSIHKNPTKFMKANERINSKHRLSTHQRNLSIDFRSMGILLPPISQVTNSRLDMTHHRNRSLDSVLQKIPEVEITTPTLETDPEFRTRSMIGPIACAKINSFLSSQQNDSAMISDVQAKVDPRQEINTRQIKVSETSNVPSRVLKNKKPGEVVSLGSDDSGIICGSESDRLSLNNVRRSYESIDSSEVEEEGSEILDTSKLNEEYQTLKSDLLFYQNPDLDLDIFSRRTRIASRLDNESQKLGTDIVEEKSEKTERKPTGKCKLDIDVSRFFTKSVTSNPPPTTNEEVERIADGRDSKSRDISPKVEAEISKSDHIKNEIPFKHFFGATKNAIFRTAQSIIENHDKKNSTKCKEDLDMKISAEVIKKRELFATKLCSHKGKTQGNFTNSSATGETLFPIAATNIVKMPGAVKCFVRKNEVQHLRSENGPSGLLRFFESPVFNIHFAIHYLFYSKEPGVLSFIGNKIFSFTDQDVDLYMPQLIVMYIQMDEVAEVLDPYLTHRCQKSVDFSLKCLWLLEAYNYQTDLNRTSTTNKQATLSFIKELHPKSDRRAFKTIKPTGLTAIKRTHHRSQSDATVVLSESNRMLLGASENHNTKLHLQIPARLCLGDLSSGKAFENGCTCFESVRGAVNGLLGHKTVCCCGAPKMAPQKEFMKALINIGKNLTSFQMKTERTSALRMFLNLINKNLPARVWLPLYAHIPHHIVRITEEKTAVLNSKDKSPYIIYVEVVEVSDIYSSPLIVKMMPTLRHTKSEENLELKEGALLTVMSDNLLSKNSNSVENRSDYMKLKESEPSPNIVEAREKSGSQVNLDDAWSQEDDDITAQYLNLQKTIDRDAISQLSLDSYDSRDQSVPAMFNISDVKMRHLKNLDFETTKPFSNDPEDPSAAALKEPWHEKEKLIRNSSPYGYLSNWRLLSAIIKCGDDLRQELMATQLLQMFKIIWGEECVDLWVRPYNIVCLSDDSGLIEPIPNTVSLHQIKKNSNKSLWDYFIGEYGGSEKELFQIAQKNFVHSCAAYCLISYLLQLKDRHNGNILLHSDGHIIHIDFGFMLSISPKNLGFEQSPFKLTTEFVEIMGGLESELWTEFNHLLLKGLMAARKHMDRIINLVEIMRSNAQLPCFKNGYSGTIQNLRKRFHMNLTEQELERKVEQLVQDSLKSLSTKLYDGYQYLTNGIL